MWRHEGRAHRDRSNLADEKPGARLMLAVARRPWRRAVAIVLFCLPLGAGIGLLQLRTDSGSLYLRGDPVAARTEADRMAFHDFDEAVVLVTSRADRRLDERAGLDLIKRLHLSLKALPGAEEIRLRSLAGLLDPPPWTPLLSVTPLLDTIPDDPQAFAHLVDRLHHSVLARGLFLSPDGRASALYVPIASGEDRRRFARRLEGWARASGTADFEVRLAGPLTVEARLGRRVLDELGWSGGIAAVILAALAYVLFRSAVAAVLVPAHAGLVAVSTLGAMGLCGVPVTVVTPILFVLLLVMSGSAAIALVAGEHSRHDRPRSPSAIGSALGPFLRPLLLAHVSVTIGGLSLVPARSDLLRHFGAFLAIGSVLSFVLTSILAPAMIALLPPPRPTDGPAAHRRFPRSGSRAQGRARPILRIAAVLATAGLVLAFAPGIGRLTADDPWITALGPHSQTVSTDRALNMHFWGTNAIDLVLTGPRILFFHQPRGLRILELVSDAATRAPGVRGIASPLVAFEIAAATVGHEGPVSELDAKTLEGFGQELQRASRQIDLDHVLTFDARMARVRLFVEDPDPGRIAGLEAYLEREIPRLLAGDFVEHHLSGELLARRVTAAALGDELLRALARALLGIGTFLALALRSFRSSLRILVPAAAATVVVLGLAGYSGARLSPAMSLLGPPSVAFGAGLMVLLGRDDRRGTSGTRSEAPRGSPPLRETRGEACRE